MDPSIIQQSILEGFLTGLWIVWESVKAHPWLLVIAVLSCIAPKRKRYC